MCTIGSLDKLKYVLKTLMGPAMQAFKNWPNIDNAIVHGEGQRSIFWFFTFRMTRRGYFSPKILQFWATFPPMYKKMGLFSAKLVRFRLYVSAKILILAIFRKFLVTYGETFWQLCSPSDLLIYVWHR